MLFLKDFLKIFDGCVSILVAYQNTSDVSLRSNDRVLVTVASRHHNNGYRGSGLEQLTVLLPPLSLAFYIRT